MNKTEAAALMGVSAVWALTNSTPPDPARAERIRACIKSNKPKRDKSKRAMKKKSKRANRK
jgi:hypothetical protein